MYLDGDVYFRKHIQLDIHCEIHLNTSRRDVVNLKGINISPIARYIIYGVSCTSFFCYKEYPKERMRIEEHRNVETKKHRHHMLQAMATLHNILKEFVDLMLHMTCTMPTR